MGTTGRQAVARNDDNPVPLREGGAALVPPPFKSTASFIAAIRIGDRVALRQLYVFYAPLLRDQARRMGVPADERDHLVTTLLGDFALRIQERELEPRYPARYLIGALRNRARTRHRDVRRRVAREEQAYDYSETLERVVAECHSEFGLRSVRPADAEPPATMRDAIEKLAQCSAMALTDADRALMAGVSARSTLREIAEHMGISHGAARVRVHRLRERMMTLARQHVAALQPAERRELMRFFRRAGVYLEEAAATPTKEDSHDVP